MAVVQTEMTIGDETVSLAIEVDPEPIEAVSRGLEGVSFGGNDDADTPGRGARKVSKLAKDLFGVGMKTAFACGRSAVQAYLAIPEAERPDGVELQLAFNLDTSVGAILAKVGAGAQVQIRMRWGS